VGIIAESFPTVLEADSVDLQCIELNPVTTPLLDGILDLFDRIPEELLATAGDEYPRLIMFAASLRGAVQMGKMFRPSASEPGSCTNLYPVPAHRMLNFLTLFYQSLSKCSDEAPSAATHGLDFIKPESTRSAMRLDLSSVETVYHNGEWKAATVLGGAVMEALLLWAIQQKSSATSPIAGAPQTDPTNWKAKQLIGAATNAKLISQETSSYAHLAKDARDLIHPARVLKEGYGCDQSTAAGAIAAVYAIIRDLAKTFS
jgi:hypothetical protein